MRKSIAFLSLAEKSTGELTYLVSSLNASGASCNLSRMSVLFVSTQLAHAAIYFPGMIRHHDHSKSPLKKINRFLTDCIFKFDIIICIDVNCFILERNLHDQSLREFYTLFHEQIAAGKKIAFIDYFECFHNQKSDYDAHKASILSEIRDVTAGFETESRFSFYVSKFLPKRISSQIQLCPSGTSILRPVPLNFPKAFPGHRPGIYYYRNCFASDYLIKTSNQKRNFLFAFSKYFENTIDRRLLRKLFIHAAQGFVRRFSPDEIVVIDPFGCTADQNDIDGTRVTSQLWIDKPTLCKIMGESYFVALFVPYGTLGTIAIMNGVPFVAVNNSVSSSLSPHVSKIVGDFKLLPYNALGVLEDHGFFKKLKRQNPYFDAVSFCDLADPCAFDIVHQCILSGTAQNKAVLYRQKFSELRLPTLSQVINECLIVATDEGSGDDRPRCFSSEDF